MNQKQKNAVMLYLTKQWATANITLFVVKVNACDKYI